MKKITFLFGLFSLFAVQLTTAQVIDDTIGAGSDLVLNSNSSNYVDFGTVYNSLNFPFTVEAWLYPTTAPTYGYTAFFQTNNPLGYTYNYAGAYPYIYNNLNIGISFGDDQGEGYQNRRGMITVNTVPLNAWTHVAIVAMSMTDIYIYFNGVLQAIQPDNGGSTITAITHSPGPTTLSFNGQLDEVRLWNDSLSQTTIQQNMCRKIDPHSPGLIGYWRLDEASNSDTVYDYSSNHFNGAFVGTVNRAISTAPVGNTSANLYTNNWNNESVKLGSATGDTLTAVQVSGNPDGVQVYAVNSAPYFTEGLKSTPDSYFGVFSVNGSSPAYTVNYKYSLTDSTINIANEDSANLSYRIDATDTPWDALNAALDVSSQTISKTNQPSPQEYILDISSCAFSSAVMPQSPSICIGQSVALTASGGISYTWSPSTALSATTGDTVIASPTITTTYTITAIAGVCSSIETDIVFVSSPPDTPAITQHKDTLISSAKQGNQWVRNDTVLQGATNQSYIVTISGEYKVITENPANGCSSTSAAGYYTPTGINGLTAESGQVTVYPNPTGGEINVTVSSSAMDVNDWNLQVTDVLGRTVYTPLNPLKGTFEIDLSNLASGVYFICVMNKMGRVVVPVVKQ